MDASEVAEAFSKLKKDRKVLHFGVSNFLPSQFDLLSSFLDFPLVTNQISFS
jgi:predicted oxidoreductase